MTHKGARSPFLAPTYPVPLASPRPRSRISFPHHSQVAFHASKQWKPHALTRNCKPLHRLILLTFGPAVALAALGGLCHFSCVSICSVWIFFSRNPQQHMPAVVIPSPLSHSKS